jgi:hypothetical protein
MYTSVSQQDPTIQIPSYPAFFLLPAELRLQIWEATLPNPRWINSAAPPDPPVALFICRESRSITLCKFSRISRFHSPNVYINWNSDIIDASILGKPNSIIPEGSLHLIQNLAIRRFDPDDENPATIWQRSPRYQGWPLCSFRFNCSVTGEDVEYYGKRLLNAEKLKGLRACFVIVPAREQWIFLDGIIKSYVDTVRTMKADMEASSGVCKGKVKCTCGAKVHPEIKLVEEIAGENTLSILDCGE